MTDRPVIWADEDDLWICYPVDKPEYERGMWGPVEVELTVEEYDLVNTWWALHEPAQEILDRATRAARAKLQQQPGQKNR